MRRAAGRLRAAVRTATGCVVFVAADTAAAQVVLQQYFGTGVNPLFGNAVAATGDLDGDGHRDLVIGSPWDNSNGSKAGRTYVYSVRTGALLRQWQGNSAGDEHGLSVATAGDVDGDGVEDVLSGAHLDDVGGIDTGTAYVYSGATGAVLWQVVGTQADDNLGAAVAPAGDFDGDGRADFIVASHHTNAAAHHAGAVYVRSGATGGVLFQKFGGAADEDLGHSVAMVGDVDLDGRLDLVAGAHGYDGTAPHSGGAFVYSGASGATLFTFSGDNTGDDAGRAVAAAGDVNGDGRPDILVGIQGDDDAGAESGSVRLFSGASGALLREWDGQSSGDLLGQALQGEVDFSGDGVPDVVIGAPGEDDAGFNTGSTRVYSGATGALLHQIDGVSAGLRFWRAYGAADFDLDGAGDLVVGIPYDDTVGPDLGWVAVYSGNRLGWTKLGGALAGGLGPPQLDGSGYLGAGTTTTLALEGAASNAPCALLFGLSAVGLPLYGGTLVPNPQFVLTGLATSPSGTLALAAPWPAGVPSGIELYFQYWLVDPTGPLGFAASNAVRARTP